MVFASETYKTIVLYHPGVGLANEQYDCLILLVYLYWQL